MGTNQSDEILLRSVNRALADWEQARDAQAVRKLDELLSPDLLFRRADKSSSERRSSWKHCQGRVRF
jgi:hypothetical protein